MLERIGGRKFLLAIIILIVGTIVQIKSAAGVNESFVALLVGIMASFGATNAWVTTKGMAADSAPQPDPLPQNEARLDELSARITELQYQLANSNQQAEQMAGALNEVAKAANLAGNLAKAAIQK